MKVAFFLVILIVAVVLLLSLGFRREPAPPPEISIPATAPVKPVVVEKAPPPPEQEKPQVPLVEAPPAALPTVPDKPVPPEKVAEAFKYAQNGDAKSLSSLVRRHPGLLRSTGREGMFLLHCAATWGKVDAVRILLDAGAQVDALDKGRCTPLHEASSRDNVEVIRLLLDRGANLHARTESGWEPLHQASDGCPRAIAELLLSRGANVNAQTNDGRSALHMASMNNRTKGKDRIDLLLKNGADVHARTDIGYTPLHYARDADIALMLINAGSDTTAKDRDQKTPLEVAEKLNRADVVELLKKHEGANAGKALRGGAKQGIRPPEPPPGTFSIADQELLIFFRLVCVVTEPININFPDSLQSIRRIKHLMGCCLADKRVELLRFYADLKCFLPSLLLAHVSTHFE
jgi:ankyrin repeat protein